MNIDTNLIYGMFIGVILMFPIFVIQKNNYQRLKRRLEKENVSREDSTSRVEVLENKIKTLEAALDRALKKD